MTTCFLAAGALLLGGCGDDPSGPSDACMLVELPLRGPAEAPAVTDVALEIQEGEGVVVLATATDPQGSGDLLGVEQAVGVFPDVGCEGEPLVVRDDLAGSGLEESFGTAVDAAADAALVGRIAASATWPVELDFRDASGNRTTGRVAARVVR